MQPHLIAATLRLKSQGTEMPMEQGCLQCRLFGKKRKEPEPAAEPEPPLAAAAAAAAEESDSSFELVEVENLPAPAAAVRQRLMFGQRANRAIRAGESAREVLQGVRDRVEPTPDKKLVPANRVYVLIRGCEECAHSGIVCSSVRPFRLLQEHLLGEGGISDMCIYHGFATLAEAGYYWRAVYPNSKPPRIYGCMVSNDPRINSAPPDID